MFADPADYLVGDGSDDDLPLDGHVPAFDGGRGGEYGGWRQAPPMVPSSSMSYSVPPRRSGPTDGQRRAPDPSSSSSSTDADSRARMLERKADGLARRAEHDRKAALDQRGIAPAATVRALSAGPLPHALPRPPAVVARPAQVASFARPTNVNADGARPPKRAWPSPPSSRIDEDDG